ncbi:hypothetical protein HY988_02370 [Candidatus Micrarchaeota archaeon]|nr:hypothetical protein [Candidatus Micrarchaeota archaeon]
MRIMRKFLVLLIVLFSITHSVSFERPWTDQFWLNTNPNIYGAGGVLGQATMGWWWNTDGFEKSLNTLNLNHVSELPIADGETNSRVGDAIRHRNQFFYILSICRIPKVIAQQQACIGYDNEWRYTVDSSLSALEASEAIAQSTITGGKTAYQQLVFTGLCDRAYTHSGNEYCSSTKLLIDQLNESSISGLPVFIKNNDANLSIGLLKPLPDMSAYSTSMSYIWGENGTIASYGGISKKLTESKAEAESEFKSLHANSISTQKEVEVKITNLDNQRLNLITVAPKSFHAGDFNTVSSDLATAKDKKTELAAAIVQADLSYAGTTIEGYLGKSVTSMADINKNYDALSSRLDQLLKNAQVAVDDQRTEAQEEIDLTAKEISSSKPNSESSKFYSEAIADLKKGDQETLIGYQFRYYYQAAAEARAARNPNGGTELTNTVSLAEFKRLIDNAKRDEINVVAEDATYYALEANLKSAVQSTLTDSIATIIDKARIKYDDDLLSTRARIMDKLGAGGPALSDLYTEMANAEKGVFLKSGAIDYPNAIGKLKTLSSNYVKIEDEANLAIDSVIANQMSVNTKVLTGLVALDQPTELTVDVILQNPREYSANKVTVPITLDKLVVFDYSNILQGAEGISQLRSSGKGLTLIIDHVAPFEQRRVIISKKEVISHTDKTATSAYGVGNSLARVQQNITFNLDYDIARLEAPVNGEISVDGRAYPNSIGPLKEGKHTLSSSYKITDAYTETAGNVQVYTIGTTSSLDYDITITPRIDLDYVDIFADVENGSSVSDFHLTSLTWEAIKNEKKVTDSKYSARVFGLTKDHATIIRVSYKIKNTPAFVQNEIDQLKAANPQPDPLSHITAAQTALDTGNAQEALREVEIARTLMQNEGKKNAALENKYSALRSYVVGEIGSLDGALSSANTSGTIIDQFSARKSVLEKTLSSLEVLSLEEKVNTLSKIDQNWVSKQITAFKKDGHKEYVDLSETYYLLDKVIPKEFSEFDSDYNRLDASNDPKDAVALQVALNSVRAFVAAQKVLHGDDPATKKTALNQLTSDANSISAAYSAQLSRAKGTPFESMFVVNPKTVDTQINDANAALSKDSNIFWAKMSVLNKSARQMADTLAVLKKESETKLVLFEKMIAEGNFDEQKKAALGAKLTEMKSLVSAGDYVNALRSASLISDELAPNQKKDNNMLLLGLAGIAVLAAAGVYLYQQQKEKKEEGKTFRKLGRVEGPTKEEKTK